MARTYAQINSMILQILQDDATIYDATETGLWIEDGLREVAFYDPHILEVTYTIESRKGTDTAGTANSLTDTTKSQFVTTTDATLEKVVHNTTDNTWAVVTDSATTVLTLSRSIFASGENYKIYNKRCTNEKQIFIGDMTDYLWIDSVEYPLGTKRNWKVYGGVLEINVDTVADSDSTLDPPKDVDVLVRFAKAHRLCQLTDLDGACSALEAEGETSIALKSLATTEIIEVGDELNIADHRATYTVTIGKTLNSGAGTGSITVTPGMESATADGDVVNFVKSTLKPQHEKLFCRLVAARAGMSKHANSISKGGTGTYARFERQLAECLYELERVRLPRTKRMYSSA